MRIALKNANYFGVRVFFILIVFMPVLAEARCSHPLLCGSDEVVRKQNRIADAKELQLFHNRDLEEAKHNGTLVPLFENEYMVIDTRLDKDLRWCLPSVRDFLLEISKKYFQEFGYSLQINSAVRTVEGQEYLRMCKRVCKRGKCYLVGECNRNAGLTHGPKASLHLRGLAVDIAKMPLRNEKKAHISLGELAWIRNYLIDGEKKGRVDATEERNQAIFHIVVF